MKNLLFAAILMLFSIAITSCGSADSTKAKVEQADQTGKEYTSAYVCPMHCEGSGSEQPGKCPVCGMDYVQNEKHSDDGHDHGDHEGHNH